MRASDIGSSFVPRRIAASYTVELDGEAVVLDEARNRLHHLNATAALVWRCFDGVGTIEEIAHDLAAAFDLPAETVRDDVLALTRELAACGLLAGVEPSEDGRALLLHRRGGQVRRG